MMMSVLFIIGSLLITATTLIGAILLPHLAHKNDFHPAIIIVLFMIALLIIMSVPYCLIVWGLSNVALGDDTLIGKAFGIYGDISANIWFSIGTIDVNYTIFKAGTKLISASAVLLGAGNVIVGKIKSK